MPSTVRIKINSAGARTILRSSEVEADLLARAQRIAAHAGPGHVAESTRGRNRALAIAVTDTFEAMHHEATDRTLTAAIGAGRG